MNRNPTTGHTDTVGEATKPIPSTPTISATIPTRTTNTGPLARVSCAPKPEARKLPNASDSRILPVSNAE